jgi:serine/threonine protein kinase/WD40 repeat protein
MNRMSMPSWDRIKAVFAEACELPAEQVPAFLDRVCEGDAEMRREVESLLAARTGKQVATGGAARELAAASTMRAAVITEGAGTVIGPYKLLQLIGEGGFGSVFLAEQTQPVRRRVAVKIIKLGMDTKQVIARFEAERQALALMDHPHIAKVLDGGATPLTERGGGRPYFVMEYVTGDPITTFANAHKLTIKDRLALFAQVCQAVQHAHMKGVIHRDIKPGNVLVSMTDGKPFAKVIDFGIAKATAGPGGLTDKTLFTEHRQLIGTPEYMSPEQAEGNADIDTRTDVYALGVLLYELLTGLTPFDGQRLRSAAYGEMQRIIKEEEPPLPSLRLSRAALASSGSRVASAHDHHAAALARHIPASLTAAQLKGELDWIVMKALDKDRARRYETPNQLAADVQRHLIGEAVVAAPPSAAYRLQKFVRRNKGAVIAGSAITAVLLFGIAGTTFGLLSAQRQKDRLQTQVAIAKQSIGQITDELIAEETREANIAQMRQEVATSYPQASPEEAEIRTLGVAANWAVNAFKYERRRLTEKNVELAALTDAAQWSAYTANLSLAQAAIEAGDYPESRRRVADAPASKRAFEWTLIEHEASSVIWSRNEPSLQCVALSPDAKEIAFSTYGAIGIYRVTDGAQLRTLKIAATDGAPSLADMSYTADGKRIVAAQTSGGRAFLLDALTGEIIHEFRDMPGSCWSVAISLDGHTVATSSDKQIDFWNAHTGDHMSRCDVPIARKIASTVRYAADGTRLLMELHDGQTTGMNCESCELTEISESERAAVLQVASRRRWSVGLNDAGIETQTRYGGVNRNDSMSLDKFLLVKNASRSGGATTDLVIYQESDEILHQLRVALILSSSFNGPSGLTITTPDGTRRIVGGNDKTVRFYEAKDGKPTLPATVDSPEGVYREVAVFRMPDAVTNLQMTGDGTRLIIHLQDGSARVWDIRDPDERRKDLQAEWAERVPAGEYLDAMWNTTNSDGSLAVPDDNLRDAVINDASLTPLRRLVAVEMLEERVEDDRLAVEEALAAITSDQTDKTVVQAAAAARTDLPKRVHAELIAKAAEWEFKPAEPSDAEKLAEETKKRRLAEADRVVELWGATGSYDGPKLPSLAEYQEALAVREEFLGRLHPKTLELLEMVARLEPGDSGVNRHQDLIERTAQLTPNITGVLLSRYCEYASAAAKNMEFKRAEKALQYVRDNVGKLAESDELTFANTYFANGRVGGTVADVRDNLLREIEKQHGDGMRLFVWLQYARTRPGDIRRILVKADDSFLRVATNTIADRLPVSPDDLWLNSHLVLLQIVQRQWLLALGRLTDTRTWTNRIVFRDASDAVVRQHLACGDPATLAAAGEIDMKSDPTLKAPLTADEHRQRAREALARAKALMQPAADGTPSPWANDEDAKALIAEAEALIGGAP